MSSSAPPPKAPVPPVPLAPAERVRSFLGWAFLLSIAIHLAFGPLLNFKKYTQDQKEVEKVSVTKKTKVVVPTPPPPTPTPPPPTPPPKSTPPPVKQTNPPPQPKLKVNVPKTHSNSLNGPSEHAYNVTKGSQNGVPQGNAVSAPLSNSTGPPATSAPTPVPTPTPTQRPSCAVPNADAAIKGQAVEPDYPDIARQQGLQGTAQIKVTLSAQGSVTGVTVYKSAGSAALDQAALNAAKQTSYTPEIVNCVPTGGSYLFRADFTNQ